MVNLSLYGFFFKTSIVIAKPIAIAMIMPMMPGSRYRSAALGAAVGAGVGVAGAGSTANAVVAVDGQYELLPANEA
jgi:hypothetical protein